MRRKIIEQQRQLEANDLNLDLENNKSSAMYNKDLYNGVVQMVEDTRSRYEIEMDNLEQENMAMTNLKKLFGKDNSEIRKSMNLLNFSTDYVKVFNNWFDDHLCEQSIITLNIFCMLFYMLYYIYYA
jgi:hypothetical protein